MKKQGIREKGSKQLIMEKIAAKTGAKVREGASSTRHMTEKDFRKILLYIEDLEIQNNDLKKQIFQ